MDTAVAARAPGCCQAATAQTDAETSKLKTAIRRMDMPASKAQGRLLAKTKKAVRFCYVVDKPEKE